MTTTYNVDCYKDVDLAKAGTFCLIEWDNIPSEVRKDILDDYGIPTECLSLSEVGHYGIYDAVVEYVFDEFELRDIMSEILKPAPHYLVFARNCRWDGASGYMFSDDVLGALSRDYDVSLYPKAVSKGGKTLVLKESSHDVPMGATTIVVALTDKEFEMLLHSEFDQVEKFVSSLERRVA